MLVKRWKLEPPQPVLPCLSLTYLGGNWSPLCVQMHLYCCLEMAKHGSVKSGLNCKLVLVKRAPILAYLTKNLIKRGHRFFITFYNIGRLGVFLSKNGRTWFLYILGIFDEESNQKKDIDFFIITKAEGPRGVRAY